MQKKIQLIGLPYAGGNKFSFNGFYRCFGDNVESVTLELPGHGKRIGEELLDEMEAMIDDLFAQITPYLNNDFVLYGHSMGGILGNLLIHRLKAANKRVPLFFLVTGCAAPKFRERDIVLHVLDMPQLKNELQKLGGFPKEILNNSELMDFVLPIIHADIKSLETFDYATANKHDVPITAIAGDNEDLTDEQLQGWKLETTGYFEGSRMKGNHFFILDHFETLATVINAKVNSLMNEIAI